MSEYLTRDKARADALFEVEVGDAKFQCRVPAALELLADGVIVMPIVDPSLGLEDQQKAARAAAEESGRRIKSDTKVTDALLARMMVRPKLWRGAEDKCPEDQVTPTILGPYRDALLTTCLPHIGYGEDRRKAVDFRDPVGDGAVAPADVEVVG